MGRSSRASLGGDDAGDATERLLPRDQSEDDAFTHEELLHSIGSFSAVVPPVVLTMLLASFASLNVVDPATADALADAYLIYGPDEDAGASTGTKFADALVNALVIVSFFLVATFVIVFCYKFNFNRALIGYMMLSSAMLLGMLGGNMVIIATSQLDIVVDAVSLLIAMYNFAVVGVVAIFYQKGTSKSVTQMYLVLTSVIMAWQLSQFPEWSTWALVVVLAFYDLCAVLTPCGPLKWLVHLVQQEGRPLPGLLYEAEIHRNQSGPRQSQANSPVIRDNVYYQCESEIPLRLGSPRPDQAQMTPRERQLRERLQDFYAKHNPSAISRIDKIVERYRGREEELWHDLRQKYITEQGDEDETIKLGLGDFVFYSVLVSRAAKYDFSAMIGCLTSILMGLGGTLFLLGIYKKALPALPISILLATGLYFWLRFVFVEYASTILVLGAVAV